MNNPTSSFRNDFFTFAFFPLVGCLHSICSLVFSAVIINELWVWVRQCVFLVCLFYFNCVSVLSSLFHTFFGSLFYLGFSFCSCLPNFFMSVWCFNLSMNLLNVLYIIHLIFLFSNTNFLFPQFTSLPLSGCSYDHWGFSVSFPVLSKFEPCNDVFQPCGDIHLYAVFKKHSPFSISVFKPKFFEILFCFCHVIDLQKIG